MLTAIQSFVCHVLEPTAGLVFVFFSLLFWLPRSALASDHRVFCLSYRLVGLQGSWVPLSIQGLLCYLEQNGVDVLLFSLVSNC